MKFHLEPMDPLSLSGPRPPYYIVCPEYRRISLEEVIFRNRAPRTTASSITILVPDPCQGVWHVPHLRRHRHDRSRMSVLTYGPISSTRIDQVDRSEAKSHRKLASINRECPIQEVPPRNIAPEHGFHLVKGRWVPTVLEPARRRRVSIGNILQNMLADDAKYAVRAETASQCLTNPAWKVISTPLPSLDFIAVSFLLACNTSLGRGAKSFPPARSKNSVPASGPEP
ncbi:hypothetical protein M434DRAFT_30912 [Hypoxylon sp. CO27-5]|nr:hypothetical protein M434DRAFT_30912 [Hypoxylon sp. CO27-5]